MYLILFYTYSCFNCFYSSFMSLHVILVAFNTLSLLRRERGFSISSPVFVLSIPWILKKKTMFGKQLHYDPGLKQRWICLYLSTIHYAPFWTVYVFMGLGVVYAYLLLLILMPRHRQTIFESKGDKLSSSAERTIRTQGLRHQYTALCFRRFTFLWRLGIVYAYIIIKLDFCWNSIC